MRFAGATSRLALTALALVAVWVATPAAAGTPGSPGGIGLRLVEAPVLAKDDPRARIYIVDHLAPGTVIERRVEVSNSTSAKQQITLYSSAATIQDGVFVGAEGNTANEVSRWTSVTPGAVALGAGEKRIAAVRIAVADDAPPGERYGVVWAEARSHAAPSGVTQISRVGIRLYVSVGPGAAPAPDFTVESLTPSRSAQGEPVVTATVRNTGGRALDIMGTLAMSNGPGGLRAGPFPAQLTTTLAIDDTKNITITLDERLPAGPWDAVVTLASGFTERRGKATITFPEAGAAAAVATETGRGSPGVIAGGIAAAVVLSGLAFRLRRRRLRLRGAPGHLPGEWQRPAPSPRVRPSVPAKISAK